MTEKFTVEQKVQIVIESFTATNIAELCRRHGVSIAQFHRWKERFLEGDSNALGESSKGNEYQNEIDDLYLLLNSEFFCHSRSQYIPECAGDLQIPLWTPPYISLVLYILSYK